MMFEFYMDIKNEHVYNGLTPELHNKVWGIFDFFFSNI